MKVLCQVTCLLLLCAELRSVRGDYRYKIRGPPPPPPKPLPPRPPMAHFPVKHFPQAQFYNTKAKWPLPPSMNTGHRVPAPLRGSSHFQYHHPAPQLLHQQHYLWNGPHQNHGHTMPLSLHGSRPQQFQFKGPSLLLGSTSLPSWKGEAGTNHGFRAPVLKEQFLPSPPAEYQPPQVSLPLPQPPIIAHISNAIDDDKGPIHTIPAPNLSPSGNPHHNHQLHQHEIPVFSSPVLPHTHVTVQQSHGYEVREPSNDQAGHTRDGVPTYYAPDPDPSLPAPKIPATTDPHSLPSNGKSPGDLLQPHHAAIQILDNSGNLANGLSSQELFELLHAPQQHQPQQPLVDSYGVPLVQQPQLQQHFQQQAHLYPPTNFLKQVVGSEQVPDNSLVLKTIRDEFNPDYHSFNYEEQYQGSPNQQDNYRGGYQEQEGSENVPSVTVLRTSPESVQFGKDYESKSNSVTEEDAFYDNGVSNPETEEEYQDNNNEGAQKDVASSTSYVSQVDGALGTPYYTTLPNREAAETLATLAAAGNINSNLVNHIKNSDNAPIRSEVPPEEEDYVEEEEEEEETEGPPVQISKPNYQKPKETEEVTRFTSDHRHHQRRPVTPPPQEEVQDVPEYSDYGSDLDTQGTRHVQGQEKKQEPKEDTKATNLQFGARIRPKRNK